MNAQGDEKSTRLADPFEIEIEAFGGRGHQSLQACATKCAAIMQGLTLLLLVLLSCRRGKLMLDESHISLDKIKEVAQFLDLAD